MSKTQELDVNAVEQFADHLETAITFLRRYRSIVLSERFPDWLVERLKSFGLRYEPDLDHDYYESELIEAGLLAREDVPVDPENGSHDLSPAAAGPEPEAKLSLTLADLRLRVKDLNTYDKRDKALAPLLEVANLNESEAASLAVCQRLIREYRGCDTPFEEFFDELLRGSLHEALTPDDVREMLPAFESNWNDLIENVRKFQADHPRLLTFSDPFEPGELEDLARLSICHARGIESLANDIRSKLPVAQKTEAASAKA